MAELVPLLALTPTMTEGTIAAWKIEEGGSVKNGALLAEVETDKAVMDYEASNNGILLKILVPQGSTVQVGQPIAIIGKEGEDFSKLLGSLTDKPESVAPPAKTESAVTSDPVPEAGSPPSSPLARHLASEAGLELGTLSGTGPHGRVVKRDVEEALKREASKSVASGFSEQRISTEKSSFLKNSSPLEKLRLLSPPLADRSVPLSRFKAVSARRLSESVREAPHFYLRSAVEMDRLLAFRSVVNQNRSEDSKISLNAFFIKLSAMAIAKNSPINVSWGESALTYHSSVDIALAVAVSEGLVAPVVRDCYHRSLEDIEGDLRLLIAKARSGALAPEDYEGATFTISNLGAWGVEEFTAIINPPGSAILAIGSTVKEPVVRPRADGTDRVVIRSMLRATLSCDHRTIDGAQGAQFMGDLKKYFEEPAWGLL